MTAVGTVFDIQRFSVHDGPGIRTTVFLKGCSLRCAWCQNPEGLERGVRLWNFDNLCSGCGACVAACPNAALAPRPEGGVSVSAEACVRCGACIDTCTRNAMAFDGYDIDAGALAERLLSDKVFYDSSGGGVTFSGGEPVLQSALVHETAVRLADFGIGTAIETSMACEWENFAPLLESVRDFIVDLKIFDPGRHEAATGRGNAQIFENFRRLSAALFQDGRLKVRIPVIPGYTDDDDNLSALGRFIGGVCPGVPLELMNFNPLAEAKYRRMRMCDPFPWHGTKPVPDGLLRRKFELVRAAMRD